MDTQQRKVLTPLPPLRTGEGERNTGHCEAGGVGSTPRPTRRGAVGGWSPFAPRGAQGDACRASCIVTTAFEVRGGFLRVGRGARCRVKGRVVPLWDRYSRRTEGPLHS